MSEQQIPEQKFSLDDAMAGGWKVMLDNFWTFLGLLSLAGFLTVLPQIASAVCNLNPDWWAFSLFLSLLGVVLHVIVFALGPINVQIKMCRGLKASSDDLWGAADKFFPYIGASLIYLWVVVFGTFMFVVPGIIFGIMFMFYPYFIVEHKLGPIQALKASAAITSGAMWELLFLCLMLTVIRSFAPLAFFVGIIPAHMFCELAVTKAYMILLDKTPGEQLPFVYVGAKVPEAHVWEDSMGYDDPVADASLLAFDQKLAAGAVIKTPSPVQMETVSANSHEVSSAGEASAAGVAAAGAHDVGTHDVGTHDVETRDVGTPASEVSGGAEKSEGSQAVDNKPGENDKSGQEH
jgi:hypothetical protein